ncbi:hypothetical protein Aduo_004145 [Ancylostoma duodenale]
MNIPMAALLLACVVAAQDCTIEEVIGQTAKASAMIGADMTDDPFQCARKCYDKTNCAFYEIDTTQITLLLALLMVVLYILEMICGSPSKAKAPTPLPTAVVIQPKEDKEKKEKEPKNEVPKDDCRHNTNRHFPSKTILLQLDVKRPDKEKEEKEKQAKAASAPTVVSVPVGAPPPYVETKKVPAGTAPGADAAGTPGVSTTQDATAGTAGAAPLAPQPPPLAQLRAAVVSPRRAQAVPPGGQPSLPVPARPPFATSPRRIRTPRKAAPPRSGAAAGPPSTQTAVSSLSGQQQQPNAP